MILYCFIVVVVICILFLKNREKFAGALTQLYAKGPQDKYLTVGTEKYVPPEMKISEMYWNNPTRLAYPYGYYPFYIPFAYYSPFYYYL